MIAYNQQWLDNQAIRHDIEDAYESNAISKEEKTAVEAKYPVGFYSPNYFVRVGLFILTGIIAGFTLGVICLMTLSALDKAFTGIFIFFSVLCYAALEFFVRRANHYRSGVDDALLWAAAICLLLAINIDHNISASANALIIFIMAGYFTLRFADMLMAATTVTALIALVFLNYTQFGAVEKATAPFLLMVIAAAIYFISKKIFSQQQYRNYHDCNIIVQIVSLVCFYAAANYFVVREISNEMFDLQLPEGQSIPYGWLFWIFTITIPVIYIARGLQKKDAVILRVGLLLVAAIVFTIRYYNSVWPIENIMLPGGIALIAIAYMLTRWLAEPKMGFTSAAGRDKFFIDKMNVEALAIAETFGHTAPSPEGFGGGSFGGGGASGEF